MNLNDRIAKLHASPWKGVIIETGLGVPVQSQLTSVAGASATIFYGSMPYSKECQPQVGRAVSDKMATEMAREEWDTMNGLFEGEDSHRFVLAVTGAHKRPDEHGMSHAWVAVATARGESMMHFSIPRGINRVDSIQMTGEIAIWFLYHALLSDRNWEEAVTEEIVQKVKIDVLNSSGVDIQTHLKLCRPDNPLLYHHGRFHRVTTYLREYNRIYRGTFFPPTIAHAKMGAGALFDVTLENARKKITPVQVEHTMKMLDLIDAPVLISKQDTFINFHRMVMDNEAIGPTYILGTDTFNAMAEWTYEDKSTMLPFFEGEATFEVHVRAGQKITECATAKKLKYKVAPDNGVSEVSSTKAREGDLESLPERVREYFKSIT
jgi:hypothetical protein